jgi:hypothetical protein
MAVDDTTAAAAAAAADGKRRKQPDAPVAAAEAASLPVAGGCLVKVRPAPVFGARLACATNTLCRCSCTAAALLQRPNCAPLSNSLAC